MKIYARTRDEILKDKAEYDSQMNEYRRRDNIANENYQTALKEVCEPIKQKLLNDLAKFDLLEFQVRVEPDFSDNVEVKIDCDQNRLFDENSALTWSYFVTSRDGEPVVSPNGSTKFNVSTPEGFASLEQNVEAIKYLNSVDWVNIVNTVTPDWNDYADKDNVRPESRNFDRELLIADLEDEVVDKSALAKIKGQNAWMLIESATPKFYNTYTIKQYELDEFENDIVALVDEYSRYADKHKKEAVYDMIQYPLEVLE